jgi:class 3 adenylate cyclase/PAS domain-containing protein
MVQSGGLPTLTSSKKDSLNIRSSPSKSPQPKSTRSNSFSTTSTSPLLAPDPLPSPALSPSNATPLSPSPQASQGVSSSNAVVVHGQGGGGGGEDGLGVLPSFSKSSSPMRGSSNSLIPSPSNGNNSEEGSGNLSARRKIKKLPSTEDLTALVNTAGRRGSLPTNFKLNKLDGRREGGNDSDSDSSEQSAGLNTLFQNTAIEEEFEDDGTFDSMNEQELREQVKLLRKINNFTRDIAENSNQAIIVVNSFTKKIFWLNGRAQIIFGRLSDDLLGQNVNVLIPDEIARKHDKIMDTFIGTWAREHYPPTSKVVNPRTPREIKAVRHLSDGSRVLFDAEIFVRYVKTGTLEKAPPFFVAYLNDIAEMKSLKHQLNVSKVIQQKSAEAIVVCDTAGKIGNCNAMAEQMFGTSLSFLLAHNKNIKWFMPKNIADRHDGYLSAFRDNLAAGYDVQKSTIIGKSRSMRGRRPGEKEDELFSIVLRVELVASELVAYIRDTSDTITRAEFDEAIVTKVFPKCIKSKVLRAQVDPYEICEHLVKKTVVYTDLSNFTRYSNGTDISDVYKFINNMYKAFDHLIPHFAGELVKRTGDGVIIMFGLEGKASKHADRAVYCSMAMMNWAEQNGYNMRIGISTGDVGSGVFGDGESRPAWDVLGECVNLASRMQSYGVEGRVQISETTFDSLSDPRLNSIFVQRTIENVKGYGNVTAYLSTQVDQTEIQPLLQRRIFEIDHERKRILEREKRLNELGAYE